MDKQAATFLMSKTMDKMKLGQALLKTNKITQENLKYAMTMHEKIGGDFAALLVKLGYVTDDEITYIIGKLEGIETIDLTNIVIPKKLVQSIPRDVIEKHNLIPISRKGDQITLAMANVNDYEAIEEIQFLTGCKLEPVLASREAIRKAVIQFYSGEENIVEDKNLPATVSKEDIKKTVLESPLLAKVLVDVLIEKNIITYEELFAKIKAGIGES